MSWLYSLPFLLVAAVIVVSLLGALELGQRLARWAPLTEQQSSTVAAPILALTGLLLAFSFSMASDRLALRRAAAVQEANSIGTFWLRTSMLPEPGRSESRSRVRRYIDLHFEHRRAGVDAVATEVFEGEVGRIQEDLWAILMADARREPEASRLRLVAPALNAMFDDAASVLAARENRLPDAMFLYLFLLVVAAGVVVGYRPRDEKRSPVLWAIFIVALSGVLILLLDADRPRRGLIETDMRPYARLLQSMKSTPP